VEKSNRASMQTCCNWWTERNLILQLSRLQKSQGRDAIEKVADRVRVYIEKDVFFQSHHPGTKTRGGATQQHTAIATASADLPHHSGRSKCPHP
jgi:hypothetical protein